MRKKSGEEGACRSARVFEAAAERRALGHGAAQALERALGLARYERAALAALPRRAASLSSGVGDPLRAVEVGRGAVVLDLGCGCGLDLVLAARRVGPEGALLGVEASEALCRRAEALAQEAGADNARVICGLAEALPLASSSVDLVLVNALLSHLPSSERALVEAARVLVPGGRLSLAEVYVTALPAWARLSGGLADAGVTGAPALEALLGALSRVGLVEPRVARQELLGTAELEALLDRAQADLEVAGCSASGAIMASEAAAALTGVVGVVVLAVSKPGR